MPRDFSHESLSHDPIHGYIPFVSKAGLSQGGSLRAGDYRPSVGPADAAHSSVADSLVGLSVGGAQPVSACAGGDALASRVMEQWYDSLKESCPNVPSRAYVESLARMAALLHDVGHGPFGHFFDDQYLDQFGITHEDIGAQIIESELGDLLRGIRRNPNGSLQPLEEIDPKQVAFLIRRPKSADRQGHPAWLVKMLALFSGIYTVDNMDFVLRDAFMTGFNTKAFDISRLIHYSFFTPEGLTIHVRGLPTLIHFIETRANMFRTVYFHRTVRALDLALEEIFGETMPHLFQGTRSRTSRPIRS